MAQLQSNCAVATTPGVAGAYAAEIPATFAMLEKDLTDWEFFMLDYRMRYRFICTNPDTDATTKLYVKNLPEYLREEDLMKIFSFFGRIANLVLMRDKTTSTEFGIRPTRGKSKCCGYVYFQKLYDATKAVEALNGIKYDDKEWSVGIVHKKMEAVDQYQVTNPDMNDLPREFGSSCKIMQDKTPMV